MRMFYTYVKTARNDHLSHAIYFWNQQKQNKMHKILSKRLCKVWNLCFLLIFTNFILLINAVHCKAKSLVTEYSIELESLLRNNTAEDMKKLAQQLIEEYSQSISK